jgi:hypothetical protein
MGATWNEVGTEVGYGLEVGITTFTSGDEAPRHLVYLQPVGESIIGLDRNQAMTLASELLAGAILLPDEVKR